MKRLPSGSLAVLFLGIRFRTVRVKAKHRLAFRFAQLGHALERAPDGARARADQLVQLAAGLIEAGLGLRQAGLKLVKLGLDRAEHAPHLARALLDRDRAEGHLQTVQQRRHRAGACDVDMVVALEHLDQTAVYHLGVQPLKRQKQDAEIRGVRRLEVFIVDVLGLGLERGDQLLGAGVDLLARAVLIGVAQRAVGVARELGVDRQPDVPAVLDRQLDRILDHVAAARPRGDVHLVLVRREDVLQNRAQLDLAHDAAGLDIGEHLFQVAHTLRERLHLTKALVDLLQPLVDQPKGLVHPLGQGLLQLFVYDLAHIVQFFVVVHYPLLLVNEKIFDLPDPFYF